MSATFEIRANSRPARQLDPKDPISAWDIKETEYPDLGETWEKLSFCLNYAILAPSSHNSQPWRFKLGLEEVKLYADRTRGLPVVDPEDRQLVMSCGAALYNLRLAIRHFGHLDDTYLFPDGTVRDLLALVQIGRPGRAAVEEHAMFAEITSRRTNRQQFESREVPCEILANLHRQAATEGADLLFISEPEARDRLVALICEGDCVQMSNPSFRRELAAWIHPARSATRDGIPGYAYGLSELLDFTTPMYASVLRTFDLGNGIAARDRKLADGSPVLAVLTTEADTQAAWLSAGQALERVLLSAAAQGISASFLNQPIEVASLRPKLCEAQSLPGFPQIILRLGYGQPIKPTPRRHLRDTLMPL